MSQLLSICNKHYILLLPSQYSYLPTRTYTQPQYTVYIYIYSPAYIPLFFTFSYSTTCL